MNTTPQTSRKWLFRLRQLLRAGRNASSSLRVRIGLSVIAASAAGFALLALFFGVTVERETRAIVANQQHTIVRNVAGDVGRKVSTAQEALAELARRVPRERLHDAAAMEALIRSDGALFTLFDDIVVVRDDGVLVADWPIAPGRRGWDRSGMEHIRAVLATGTPQLSKPFIGPLLKTPVIVLAVPVLDSSGRAAGAVAGLLQLRRPNFLGELFARRVGSTGFFVLADREGTVMVHPRPERVMTAVRENGAGAALASLRRGADGMHESAEGKLYAASAVAGTAWTLLAVLPMDEAYRSLASMRWTLAVIFALLLAATGALLWPLVGRMLAPLAALRAATQAFAPDPAGGARLDLSGVPRGSAEIDALADAFRRAVDRTESAKAQLSAERAFVNAVLENAGALVVVLDREGRIRRFNRACEELSGYRLAEVEGKFPWDTVLPPEDAATIRQEAFEALARNPQALSGRYTNHWVTKARDKRLIEWFNTVLPDAEGGIEHMVSVGIDITERSRADDALRLSQARLTEAQRIAHVGSWELDLVTDRLAWSDEIFRIFEIDAVRFGASYEAFLATIHPDDRDAVNRAYTGSVANRTPYELVHRLRMADGRIKWVRERCETSYNATGEPLRSVGTVQDITAQAEIECKLREERNFSAAIYDSTPALVIVHDRHGRIVRFNDNAAQAAGYRKEELVGQHAWELLMGSPEDRRDVQARYAALASMSCEQALERFGSSVTRTWRRRDGGLREIAWNLAYLPDENGMVAYQVACGYDITDRRVAEAVQRDADRRMRAFMDDMPALIAHFDMEQRFLYANRTYGEFFGIDPRAIVGATLAQAIGEENARFARPHFERLVAGEHVNYEGPRVKRDGRIGYVRCTAVPEFGEDGRQRGFFVLTADDTARKQAEDRIRAALAEKDVLLKEIYHRVKNNLQVVSSLLNMQERGVADEGMKALLAENANRVKSMSLVHEQLYRSQDLSSIALAEYLRQLTEHLQYAHRPLAARVPLRLEVSPELKLGIETAVPLGLIVNELVSNAYKHGYAADTARGEIVLRAEALGDGRMQLEVADDGRGLAESFAPQSATSLGMQLVVALAAQLGGELHHRSEAGHTSFAVVFRPEAREAERLVA